MHKMVFSKKGRYFSHRIIRKSKQFCDVFQSQVFAIPALISKGQV